MQMWMKIEEVLKLEDVRFRWYDCGNYRGIWTTETLYDGGDYMAALIDADLNVLTKVFETRRKDAKDHVLRWLSIYSSSYVIQEMP